MIRFKEYLAEKNLTIGDMTTVGRIEDEYEDQYQINGEWYSKAIITPSKTDKYTYPQIISILSKERGKGNIKLFHGTDIKFFNEMMKKKKFGHDDGSIVFMTHSKKEATDYSKIKSKYRGLQDKKSVVELDIPKWSVKMNRATGEYESEFLFLLKGNRWVPSKPNVVKVYNDQTL